jgi:uncharacterized Zn-binding protein involved in type VI secretion
MAGISRIGDTVSVHECGVTPTASVGSSDVKTNNINTHRQGDKNSSHPYAPPIAGCPEHQTTLSSGSSSVFVNDKQVARNGDPYGCGIALTQGSSNVFAG